MTCPNSCAAAAASPTVTVEETVLTLDGARVRHYNDPFTGAEVSFQVLELTHWPVDSGAVQMALNGVVQLPGSSYQFQVHGNLVSLGFTPAATDSIHFMYLGYVTTGESNDGLPVGCIIPYHGAVVPAGWVAMDGVTSLAIADHPALWAWLNEAGATGTPSLTRLAAFVSSTSDADGDGTTDHFVLVAVSYATWIGSSYAIPVIIKG